MRRIPCDADGLESAGAESSPTFFDVTFAEVAMPIRRFSTADVPAHERLDYWREAICDVFVQLDCRSARQRGFGGVVTSESFERLNVADVDAEGQHVVRGRRQLAKTREDDFILSIQVEGSGIVRQDGRDARLEPGSMALYATTRSYELIFPGRFRQRILQLPRALLTPAIDNPDALTARRLPAELPEARFFGAVLAGVQGRTMELAPTSRTHVAASLVASLAAALITLPAAQTPAGADCGSVARIRICAFVRAHLDNRELTPALVAGALGFSRGHVHRLFAGHGESLERYIWRLRLERVRADLTNPALTSLPIAELAARAGFASAEHFSRAFRARYGSTPLAFRRAESGSLMV